MTAIVANESVNVDLLNTTAFIGVVTGATTANSSIDGVTFTARTLATSTTWTGVAASQKTAVAVASGNRTVNTSPDGITWTAQALALPSTAAWSGVVWGEADGLFVAVSTTSSTAAASSPDGIVWTARTLPSSQNWLAVGYGNGSYVATSGASSTSFAYSTNGTSWNASSALGTAGDWRSVCWGNTGGSGTWVSVAYNSANVAYSTDDGASWTVAANLPSTANWSSVTYGNGRFVAIAFGSTKAAWSTDGITWTPAVLPTSLNWISIAYSEGLKRFAAYAQGSTSGCATSADGDAWTTRAVVSASWTSVCASPLRWSSGDTLTINNGSTVTVNTNQTKFWKTITIADGKLRIENTSTTVPLVFALGRTNGATLNSIVPTNGLGSIEIDGDWIQIGTSDGSPNQTFDGKYTEHIPYLEVETGSGTGIYEIWLNATGGYGDNLKWPTDGFNGVGSGQRGKFFTQDAGTLPAQLSVGGGVSTTNKYVTVTSTAGIFPGAAITGTGITANSVVDEVVDGTTLRLCLPTTASAGPNTYTVTNPYTPQFSSTVRFGDGVEGNIPVSGAKIRVPNICITDFTPANLQTSDRTLSARFLLSGGGSLTADKCIFSESHLIGTQAQSLTLTNCGFSLHPVITETYSLVITNVGMGVQPDRRYFASSAWSTRSTRYAGSPSWSYISNAVVTNLNMACSQPQALVGTGAATAVLNLSFTLDAVFTSCRFYSLGSIKTAQYGLYLSDTVLDCIFTDTEVYNAGIANLVRSNNNVFDGIVSADDMLSRTPGWVTTQRVGSSSLTDLPLVDGTKYYFKTRAYRDWTDLTQYHESREYSATPYLATDKFHPWNFGAVNTASGTVVLTWTQRAPTAATVAYEIYRGTTPGFTTRDASTRLYQNGTAATVTATDNGALLLGAPSNGSTYYYVLRKYNFRIANPATNTGTSGQFTVTTNQNYNNISTQAVVNCRGESGSPYVRAIGSNFDALGIIPGMVVTGTGVPAGTTVLSVDSYYQITLSANLTSTIRDSTMNFGLAVGMYVFGTGIGQNARIASIDSDTQITLDVAHSGTVSGILNFATGTESAEQEVYVQGAAVTKTNLCLQSNDFTNASWTKTNVTATTNVALAPNEIYFVNGNTLTITADRLAATSGGGTVTQSITTVAATQYTFSVYIIANNVTPQTLTSGTISFGTATQAWTATQTWQRVSVTFTATGASTTATITITTNGAAIIATGAQVETGASATPPIPTTTTTVTSGATELSSVLVWSKASAGAPRNQGIQLNFTAVGLWTEIFMDTTSGFTPSASNCIGTTIPANTSLLTLNTSNDNIFRDVSQLGVAGRQAPIVNLTTASRNQFINIDRDVNHAYGTTSQLLLMSNLCNDNFAYNWNIKNIRNSVAALYPYGGTAGTTNNNSGLILQNLKSDLYDLPFNNNYLGVVVKGVSGGAHSPLSGTATTATLGATTDGVALAYTTIYDTIFNELYQGASDGSLYLTFNASNKVTPPYTILSGTPKFANSGRLYFEVAGDSIEYTWPHTILGVTGFRSLGYKTSGVDIGNDLTTGFAIKVEYSINGAAYKEATPANLTSETLPAADVGFTFKIKLTAIANMKYSGRTSKFVVGETINGLTSGATAVIDDDENGAAGTVGTLRLSSITGSFIPGETIRSGATNRATNVATNTSFALGPSFTSYIDGLQIYTTVDKTKLYPLARPSITLTGLISGSEVRVFTTSGSVELAGTESVSGSTFTSEYDYYSDVNVYIVIMSLGYKPITYSNQTLGLAGLTIPVQQEIDRNYANA